MNQLIKYLRVAHRRSVSTCFLPSLLVALILLGITILLHGDVLDGYWRFDDGYHLAYAMDYSPVQYFFHPRITRVQAGVHVTPWNSFFYDINIKLFGFAVKHHYAHQLMLIWLTSCLTFLLLRVRLGIVSSLFGGVFFLSGIPTSVVAHQLMTGHYATGLVFIQLSLYLFIAAVHKRSHALSAAGALFYLLAVSCKEVYVPLIAIVPFLPFNSFVERAKLLLPYVFVAVFYVVWRYLVLGTLIGGYSEDLAALDYVNALKQLGGASFILFGSDSYAYLALLILIGLFVWSVAQKRIPWLLFLFGIIALAVPLIPLTLTMELTVASRYFYVFWWAVSMLLAYLLEGYRSGNGNLAMVIIASILIGLIIKAQSVNKSEFLESDVTYSESLYRFVSNPPQDNRVLLIQKPNWHYYKLTLNLLTDAYGKANIEPAHKVLVVNEEDLFEVDTTVKRVFTYDSGVGAIVDITDRVPENLHNYAKKYTERHRYIEGKLLRAYFHYDGKELSWSFGPYTDGRYEVLHDLGRNILPATGTEFLSYNKPLDIMLEYLSPEGWRARTPSFRLDPSGAQTVDWKGTSILPVWYQTESSRTDGQPSATRSVDPSSR
jgi:hypothetical protein